MSDDLASSGHLLGQLIGDWWERYVVLPAFQSAARQLDMFADNRFVARTCRKGKLLWPDLDGNQVDYDFVLELGGSESKKGVPVAFMECFWRRGARHSKDKARDDANKLLPMRETYPSARFLAIAASGEFTEPAREYVRSRGVTLFYIPKTKILAAFASLGFEVDYDDRASEVVKNAIVRAFQEKMDNTLSSEVSTRLSELVGEGAFTGFVHTIVSALSAEPVEIEILEASLSEPIAFRSIESAAHFLERPKFHHSGQSSEYRYRVVYSDGTEFSRSLPGLQELRDVNNQLLLLRDHLTKLHAPLTH